MGFVEPLPCAWCKRPGQSETAYPLAMQRLAPVAGCRDHPLDLVILALHHGECERVVAARLYVDCGNRFGLAMQQHAVVQCAQLHVVDRMARSGDIHLGHFAFRRSEQVNELAVVGEEQQAGGVLIQPAHALHAALGELRRQQAEHAQVMLRVARTFVARRLVQKQIGVLAIRPDYTVHGEGERGVAGGEVGVGIGADSAADAHARVGDQRAALTARAETLSEENTFEIHGERRITPQEAERAPRRESDHCDPFIRCASVKTLKNENEFFQMGFLCKYTFIHFHYARRKSLGRHHTALLA
ncbi:protein of unknown function [Paraburkholderia dioscoreae]|uniref:Uncharacterized protein n=1 Tax=Paraburkholderia dioscoreae TaxID=2604047 RepID=A0A5Q4Z7Y2_9BURK|nr:protein of unknown function [Paraburkholderia dioscoreae]